MRDIFNKARQEVIDTENMEAQKYLTSNECFLFLDDLLWMFSKTVLQQIIEDNNELYDSLIFWFKKYITAENHEEHVNNIQFFK